MRLSPRSYSRYGAPLASRRPVRVVANRDQCASGCWPEYGKCYCPYTPNVISTRVAMGDAVTVPTATKYALAGVGLLAVYLFLK